MRKLLFILITALTLISCGKDGNEPSLTYTVSFDSDGGAPKPQTQTVEAGKTAIVPSNPAKEGFVFLFWHLGEESTTYNFQTPVNSNIILKAKWENAIVAQYWQVSWELGGGSWTSGDNHATRVVKGGTLAEPIAPTKAGKTFDGWYKEAALTNKINFPYSVSAVTADFTLYAKWSDPATEYWQITWELNHGAWPSTGDNHVSKVEKGNTLAEPATPTKTGNTFDGWYQEAGLINKVTFPATVTSDLKLYAKWVTESAILTMSNVEQLRSTLEAGGTKIIRMAAGEYTITSVAGAGTHYPLLVNRPNSNITILPPISGTATFKASADTNHDIFQVNNNCTLILGQEKSDSGSGGNIVIDGKQKERTSNYSARGNLISIYGETTKVIMYSGVSLINNSDAAVCVNAGTFEMKGGLISNNRNFDGGGVKVSGGKFIMEGGTISDNIAAISSSGNGGGVHIGFANKGGSFIMKGGEIKRNIAGYRGGGVYVESGSFVMEGGTIYGTSVTGSLSGHPDANHVTPFETTRGHAVYREIGASATYGNGMPFAASTNITVNGIK